MYKVIYNNKVIDVIASPQFLKILPAGQVTFASKSVANGVAGSNNEFYSFERAADPSIKVVSIEKVTAEEFSRLRDLLNSKAEIIDDKASLAERRNTAINNLSKICQTEIVNGFKIILADGVTYHFKLTAEDQLNLLSIENQLNTGASSILYHATDMPCKLFYREDMLKVIAAFRKHVLYHTTYFNVAKQYINTLTDTKKIETFTYGTDLSFATDDETVKQILRVYRRSF